MATKSAISFGLVHIPIALHTATQDMDIHFNQLHKDDHSRVKYKKTCAHCGKELVTKDIVRGFEYDKDNYVIITDEEMDAIKTEKDRAMHVLHFTKLETISPVYYDKAYQAVPNAGSEKAFELLRASMMKAQAVAVARTVLGTKETMLILIPREDGMLVQTIFFADEVKALPNYTIPDLADAEVEQTATMIESMVKPYDPEMYKEEYRERLKEAINKKIETKETIVAANSEPVAQSANVIDLMEELKRRAEQESTPPKKRGRAKKEGA